MLERYVERLRSELAGARLSPRLPGHERQWRHDLGAPRGARIGQDGDVGAGLGRHRGRLYREARRLHTNLVTYDMGGTSTDVALIRNAEPAVSNEIEIEYAMPIHVPMVEVHTVGAGGGSIARVDAAGLIAGRPGKRRRRSRADLLWPRRHRADHHRRQSRARPARPAPAARRRATRFRRRASAPSLPSRIGAPTGLDGVAAAGAVIRLANLKMAGAIRMVSVAERP